MGKSGVAAACEVALLMRVSCCLEWCRIGSGGTAWSKYA